MTTSINNRSYALFGGISLLAMAVLAGFAFGFAHNQIIIDQDPQGTFEQLTRHTGLFRAEIFAWVLILVLDVLVAWSLFQFFEQANPGKSRRMGWLRLIYSGMLATAIYGLVNVLPWLHAGEMSATNAQMAWVSVMSFENMWSISLIVFGLHLADLAGLVTKHASKIWGVLLWIAAGGYVLINTLKLLLVGTAFPADMIEMVLSLPMALGEIGLAVWLIVKGGKQASS